MDVYKNEEGFQSPNNENTEILIGENGKSNFGSSSLGGFILGPSLTIASLLRFAELELPRADKRAAKTRLVLHSHFQN